MGQFDVYRKEVTVNTPEGEKKIIIRPLGGDMLPKWLSIQERFKKASQLGEEAKEEEYKDLVDAQFLIDAHSLVFNTIKASYPNEPEKELSSFAAKNLNNLLISIMEVNFND